MLQVCSEPGCSTRTLGPLCLAHEPTAPPRSYPRGRPFRPQPELVAETMSLLTGKTPALGVVLLEGAS